MISYEPKTILFEWTINNMVVPQKRKKSPITHFQEHIKDIKSLRAKDIPLVEQMKEVGLKVLREQDGNVEKVCLTKIES